MKIAVDFDGTCVDHRYPDIGPDAPEAVVVLKELVANGHQIILYTMRDGHDLDEAVEWFKARDIPLFGVQRDPDQDKWTTSNKCYAQLYIDDMSLGAPLIQLAKFNRPCIDWAAVRYKIFGNYIHEHDDPKDSKLREDAQ
jgi:hypothetical protein